MILKMPWLAHHNPEIDWKNVRSSRDQNKKNWGGKSKKKKKQKRKQKRKERKKWRKNKKQKSKERRR